MAIKVKNGYMCSYCHKVYSDPTKADVCTETHDLVYVQISKADLGRLIQFLYVKNDELITETMLESLKKVAKP